MSPEHDSIRFSTAHSEHLWNPATGSVTTISSTRETWLAKMEARILLDEFARKQKELGGLHVPSTRILEAYFDETPEAGPFKILEAIPAKGSELPVGAVS